MIDFQGVSNVMSFFRSIFYALPDDIYTLILIGFWIFITLSVLKVLQYKEG